MKFVKRPVSLPGSLALWAGKKVRRMARDRHQEPNFSAYVATLIAEDKARSDSENGDNGKTRAA